MSPSLGSCIPLPPIKTDKSARVVDAASHVAGHGTSG